MITTEMRNPVSSGIDRKSTKEILTIINNEDKKVPEAVCSAIEQIAWVTDRVVDSFLSGGRLIYIGAGTSGRLGVLDASECPPTFGVDPSMVQGIIAGGERALRNAVEGAEDCGEKGVDACRKAGLCSRDTLVGITANGGARFVVDSLAYAKEIGCVTAAISCNPETPVWDVVAPEGRIFLDVGPEIITGSTRMKSGTAQKLTLNMITTGAMIRIGKVYNNFMVDMNAVNEKLVRRGKRMIGEITGVDAASVERVYREAKGHTKLAIVMAALDISAAEAEKLLGEESRVGALFEKYPPLHLKVR